MQLATYCSTHKRQKYSVLANRDSCSKVWVVMPPNTACSNCDKSQGKSGSGQRLCRSETGALCQQLPWLAGESCQHRSAGEPSRSTAACAARQRIRTGHRPPCLCVAPVCRANLSACDAQADGAGRRRQVDCRTPWREGLTGEPVGAGKHLLPADPLRAA